MPRSRIRRRPDYTPPPKRNRGLGRLGPARWVVPTMLTLLVLGLLWICVYYLAGERIPFMAELGGWNLAIGMALITGGFIVSTRWK